MGLVTTNITLIITACCGYMTIDLCHLHFGLVSFLSCVLPHVVYPRDINCKAKTK
jgi:hypothetical protein